MSDSPSQQIASATPSATSDSDIDLRLVAGSIRRNYRLIAAFAGSSLLLSGLYALTSKPVWEGQFQIVLENQDTGMGKLAQLTSQNQFLSNLVGLGSGGSTASSLKTEVKILESPSVLKPVYDYFLEKNHKAGKNIDRYTFSKWRRNLRVELIKGTSVLNIAYQDTNKDLVLPIIKKISQTYQTYSGRDRSRGLTQGVNYLENQLSRIRNQANNSMQAAHVFALNNGLGLQDGMPAANTLGSGVIGRAGQLGPLSIGSASRARSSGPMETTREAIQNKVNALEQQLADAKSVGSSSVFIAPQLEPNTNLYADLQLLKVELREKSALLRANDPSIRALERRISALTQELNQQTIGLLQGQLKTAKAQLKSLTRSREVILKHRELVRTAFRDEETVSALETQLQSLRLEKARQTDPWELISTPTLLDQPVAPRSSRIVALGLITGLAVGCGAAQLVDRRKGLVFSTDELKNLMPCPLVKHLPASRQETWTDAADLLATGPLAEVSKNNTVALIPIGKIPSELIQAFGKELNRALHGRELIVSTDLRKTSQCASQLLITSPGVATRTQLSQLQEKLALQGAPIAGWVLLDPDLNLG